MRFILILLSFCLLNLPAQAADPKDIILEAGKTIFTDMERRVIKEVLNRTGLPDVTADRERKHDNDKYDDNNNHKNAKKHKDKKGKGLPPGLAKKAHLPPGLAKRDTLPPGLEKRELPRELKRRLPPPPVGTERVIVDNSVLLIEQGTQIVLDIIKDVIKN
jgi:Ni/Co efflux regulator RcnB